MMNLSSWNSHKCILILADIYIRVGFSVKLFHKSKQIKMTYKLVKLVFICFIGIEFTNLKSFWEKPLSNEILLS